MRREIKFRAWDLEKRRYGEVRCINYNFEGEIDSVVCWFSVHEREVYLPGDTFIIEQDTGLKDKNGKEIYEGDIVEQSLVDDPFNKNYPLYVVCWSQEFLGWALKDAGGDEGNDTDLHFFIDNQEKIEVVGNIHENPELLKENNGED